MAVAEATIDSAVLCEKVLGWKRRGTGKGYWSWELPDGDSVARTPDFSHDIAAAFSLVEALGDQYFSLYRLNWGKPAKTSWRAVMGPASEQADTPAAAITKAVWALVQGDK